MALTDKLTAIGNAIRQKTGTAELIPLSDMPNEINSVHEAGYEKGVGDGKQAEYDAFWDSFQYKDGALRTSYDYGFYGWRGACFKPKHNLILSGQYNTYTFRHADLFDLTEMTVDRGVAFDTSGAAKLNSTFYQSTVGRIPPLDLSSCTSMQSTFANMLRRAGYTTTDIVLRNLREDCTFANVFDGSVNLENIMIESGAIGQNGFNVSACTKLSKTSITSIVNALSENTSGLSVTLSKTAAENAFLDTDGEQAKISISSKQDGGFYAVDFEGSDDRYSLLEFAVPMDISFYGAVLVDDVDLYTVDISRSGVYRLNMNEEVAATGPNGDSIDFSFAHLLGDGGQLKIKRTDGRDLSSGDVAAYLRGELNYEWFDLIATKPNWDIILI